MQLHIAGMNWEILAIYDSWEFGYVEDLYGSEYDENSIFVRINSISFFPFKKFKKVFPFTFIILLN